MNLRRTTVEIDTDALRRAAAVLGTSTLKDTVNEALRAVSRRPALVVAARYVLDQELHVPEPEALAHWRRPRT